MGRFKFFEGPRGQPAGRPAVLVKITADDGTVGWGQSVPTPEVELRDARDGRLDHPPPPGARADRRDPDDLAAIHAMMNRAIAPSFSTGQPICKAGIDLALHDLAGKLRGQHVGRGLGPPRPRPADAELDAQPADARRGRAPGRAGPARGYKHFNVKVAPDPKFDLELCRLVKRLVPDGFLWADANGGYDEATALSVAPKLADIGVPVLEQPLPANCLTGYQRLRRQKALPIIMDEGIVSSVELVEFIKLGLLDGVAMKPARCAGLTDARRQIEILENEGLMFLGSGLTDPDLSLAASLALFGAYGLKYPAALNGPQFLQGSILKHPFAVSDGELAVPVGPGLGVEVDETKIPELAPRG